MRIRLAWVAIILVLSLCLAGAAAAVSSSDVVAKRRAMMAEKPYSSTVPRANEPVGQLTVLRIPPDDPDMRFALASLQGIVNRDQPKLYLGIDKILAWTEYHSGKIKVKIEPDLYKIFDMYKDKVKGMVLYDNLQEAECNIAITYAGIEDLIPVTPGLVDTFSARYGWKVVHDLRGRWNDRLEAYKWSYENLFPRCTKFALMHYDYRVTADSRTQTEENFKLEGPGHLIAATADYTVAFKLFVWYIGNRPLPGEMELANKIMESVPLYTPVLGASGGSMYDEPALVSYVAGFANLHIPLYSYNLSVLSGVRIPSEQLRQKPHSPARDLGPNKVYIAFTNSEHDNMGHVIGGGPPWDVLGFETDDPYRIWWSDPERGRVPIGWPIGPLLSELAPSILARLVKTATDNDVFMAALSGICLTDIPNFGSVYPRRQDELLEGYAKLSGQYMKRLGWTMVNPWAPPGNLRAFIKGIPELQGVFEGYTGRISGNYERANYLMNGVPVFHALNHGIAGEGRTEGISDSYARRAKILVNQIKAIKTDERPAFMHIWTIGWDYSPTILRMVVDQLPAEYVVVRPDELAALYKRYKGSGAELKSVTPKPKPSGVVTETPNGDEGLMVDTGKIKVEIGWGATPQAPIKRVMGVDGKWRCAGNLYQYNSMSVNVTKATYEKVKHTGSRKEYQLTYLYSNGALMKLRLTAVAGRPYILIDDESNGGDIPSWSLNLYPDFEPDRLYTDTGEQQIAYGGTDALGELPWRSWMLAGRADSRDLIGFYTVSWADWDNGNILLWRLAQSIYLENYHQRAGLKRFAVAALDKNDPKSIKKVWKELNGR
ncbi:MAG: GxGYxYP family putative glycoside hydrolase [Armatimonadota bacterium]|nr:GxGYxYP family putative glycoside hydrolase [Armatimonadota bacterium]